MAFAVAAPARPDALSSRAPLMVAVLLHGSLLLAVMHGLQPAQERPQPREVLISLLPQPTEAVAKPVARTPAPAQLPRQAQPLPVPVPAPMPQRAPEPQLRPAVEPQPPAPVAREIPVTPPAPVAPAPVQHSTAPTHETRPAPPPAVPPVAHAPAPAPAAVPVQAAAPAERGPVTVSGVDYLVPPKPDYPLASKRLGEQGKVTLRLLIDEKGRAERIEVQQSSGFPRLDEAARAAVQRAAFKPHLEDGHPVPVYVTVPISFSLK